MEKVDLEELERWKEKNRQERLKFNEDYAEWLKKWNDLQAKVECADSNLVIY